MKKIKHLLAALFVTIAVFSAPASVAAQPLTQFAAPCNTRLLTFPAWYNNLECKVDGGNTYPQIKALNDIWIIALNVIEILIIASAYIAAGFIIWGGFKYMKAQGEPGKLTEAKNSILNAVIGLAIAMVSVAIVQFVQNQIR